MPTADALEQIDRIEGQMSEGTPVVLLDFDGTLAPIVERPEDAELSVETREALERLAQRCRLAIVSGRDLSDLRDKVGLESIAYAGSHGFEIALPGEASGVVRGEDYLSALDAVDDELHARLDSLAGVQIERKRFGVAVHVRRANREETASARTAVEKLANAFDGLRIGRGKEVFELQPAVDWDKGRAVGWLLENVYPDDARPIYIGDDVTDEDVFEVLGERGIGILVSETPRETGAGFRLTDPGAVRSFLEALAENLA